MMEDEPRHATLNIQTPKLVGLNEEDGFEDRAQSQGSNNTTPLIQHQVFDDCTPLLSGSPAQDEAWNPEAHQSMATPAGKERPATCGEMSYIFLILLLIMVAFSIPTGFELSFDHLFFTKLAAYSMAAACLLSIALV
jgi:hypothetical protein